jgi:hypothetical protein
MMLVMAVIAMGRLMLGERSRVEVEVYKLERAWELIDSVACLNNGEAGMMIDMRWVHPEGPYKAEL